MNFLFDAPWYCTDSSAKNANRAGTTNPITRGLWVSCVNESFQTVAAVFQHLKAKLSESDTGARLSRFHLRATFRQPSFKLFACCVLTSTLYTSQAGMSTRWRSP